jgi:hypothetical protein
VYLWYLEALFVVFLISFWMYRLLREQVKIILCAILLWCLGAIIQKLCGAYAPFGNPLKYVIWFVVAPTIWNKLSKIRVKEQLLFSAVGFIGVAVVYMSYNYVKMLGYIKGFGYVKEFLGAMLGMVGIYAGGKAIWTHIASLSQKSFEKLEKLVSYSFGIYLYAEPLNYFILFIIEKLFGIQGFGMQSVAGCIIAMRVIATPLVAIIIVRLLKLLEKKVFIKLGKLIHLLY